MESIPLRCATCPFIAPTLDRMRNLLNEEAVLRSNRVRMTEYVDETQIDQRLAQLDTELEAVRHELSELTRRTIGCRGVALTQVRDNDEIITAIHCQSPWQ